MSGDPARFEYAAGQAAMVEYFASCVAALPLETIVSRLDQAEAQESSGLAGDMYMLRLRQLDRDVAAILLQAKRELLALYTAHVSRIQGTARVRDSRPPFPAPIDPTHGRIVGQEATRHD